jgi:HD-GYP domain-containing protein (c-di-GMP phosphodiesterase class II)
VQAEQQLQEANRRLRAALEGTIRAIVRTVETRDPYTDGHQQRAAELSRAIAERMGLDQDCVDGIYVTGMIHDLGKIAVPPEILNKRGPLTDIEFEIVKIHPAKGAEILEGIDFPWPVREIVLQHHERINGTGYPQGLQGDAILLQARVLAVADVLEAMAADRPYRASLGADQAMAQVIEGQGILYDAAAVQACAALRNDDPARFERMLGLDETAAPAG